MAAVAVLPPRGDAYEPEAAFSAEDFSGRSCVIAAVSGGSDSTALLIALRHFLHSIRSDTALVAVTVDHGLRPESADEAREVGELAGRLGVRHIVKRWKEEKPLTGLSEAARLARYRLLAQAALEAGASLILTGHTMDDQRETVAMRAARGAGRGLAGMAPATLVHGCWVLRPFLQTTRQALRQYLDGQGQSWIDDPGNANAASERVRIRARLAGSPDEREELDALQVKAVEARIRDNAASARAIDAHARLVAPELVRLDRSFWRTDDAEPARLAFRALLAVVGGREQLPDAARAAALFASLAAPGRRRVLSGALADSRRDGVYLLREARDLPDAQAVDGVWDGRFDCLRPGSPFGAGAPRSIRHTAWPDAPPSLVKAAARTLPPAAVIAGPDDPIPRRILAPWASFLPSFDLALARSIARLFGAPGYAAPPFSGRIDLDS